MRSSKTGRKTSCVASAVWHVALSCWNQILPISFSSIFVNKNSFVIDCNGLCLLIFKEKWPNYDSGPKSEPNSDSFWVRRLFNVCVWVLCAAYATILLVYIPAKVKTSFSWNDNLLIKSASSVSRSQAHLAKRCLSIYTTIFVWRKDKTNYLPNQTWANCYHSRNKH